MTRKILVLVGACLCTLTALAQPASTNDTIQSNLLLKEVTITESKKRYLTSVAGSNFVFNKTDFERQQPLGTEEILRTAPGLLVQGDMGISNRLNVGIRGSNPRRSVRVLVMEDNIAMACAPYLDPQVYYNTPPERLQGIEILKGPEMLMYGGQSIYGAINYITRTPNYAPRTEVNITGGQHNFFSGMLNYGGKWNKVAADFGVMYKRFDGFIDNNSMRSVNATGKVFIDVGPRSNVYFKFNHHDEYYTTTYFGLTAFTFKHAPRSNPFDADAFSVKRTALDAGYEWKMGAVTLSSIGYYSNFDYDWWRQNFVVIRAADARRILGDAIVNSRYSYLNNLTGFGEDDWIRAGQTRGSNFRENTGNRLRNFKNSGLRQSLQWKTKGRHWSNQLDLSVGLHHERFRNSFLTADSSRFARSGRLTTDQLNLLQAWQVVAKNKWQYKRLSATAIMRMESIEMTNQNLLAQSTNPMLAGTEEQRLRNTYMVWLPGLTLGYDVIKQPASELSLHASYWKGFLPPTAGFGFLTVDANGNVTTTNITPASDINILPETSNSFDAGLRGSWARGAVSGELAYFRNDINNFYSAARNEAFQTLGKVRMQGLELSLRTDIDKWAGWKNHQLQVQVNATHMWSRILNGVINDGLIFSAATIHSAATRQEMVDRINADRGAYNVYLRRANGSDSLIGRPINTTDFGTPGATPGTGRLQRLDMRFGEEGLRNNAVPFVPTWSWNSTLYYGFKNLGVQLQYNYTGAQYSEFFNLQNETADGGLGKLPAFSTFDATLQYRLGANKKGWWQAMDVFVSGKNLGNQLFRAGRLHRNESGIMVGGFRMITAGVACRF